jgi:hypothetical protein
MTREAQKISAQLDSVTGLEYGQTVFDSTGIFLMVYH